MDITDVKIKPVEGDKKLKAFVTIKIDDCFVVRGIKVIKTEKGYLVAMPANKMKDGSFRDLAHPLDRTTREMLEEAVITEYRRVMTEDETSQEGLLCTA